MTRAPDRPETGAPGMRTAEEIARLHAVLIDGATRRFETAATGSPRHRLFALWLGRHGALREGLRVVQFAAQVMARRAVAAAGCAYRPADTAPGARVC